MAASPSAVAHRWFEEIWNQRRVDVADELLAADGIGHVAHGEIIGPAGFRQMHAMLVNAFPDQKVEVQAIAAEGENVFVHWRIRGTHTGPLQELQPSGKSIDIQGMTRFLVRDGKVLEGWDCWDSGRLVAHLQS
jgi:steroid delta-isomerase-like uncharacterized protein